MNKREQILFICAHSDDHVFGAGGTIAKYSGEGKDVKVIILSYGEKTHPWLKRHITRNIRSSETYSSDKIIGCKSIFFDLKEGNYLKEFPKIEKEVLDIIRRTRPSKIFTHTSEDPHPDHKACFKITTELVGKEKLKAEVYLFSIWNPFSRNRNKKPMMYVDITGTHKKKLEAMKQFKSQWAALTILLGGILARELKNGLHIGTRFAERFVKIK